jgi:TolA-binding protein
VVAAAEDPEAERTYQRAQKEYQQGNYDVAMTLFRQFLRQYPKSALAGSDGWG